MLSVCIIEPLRRTNSVVECDLAKVEVAGSNPVSRFFLSTTWHLQFTVLHQNYIVKGLVDELRSKRFDCFEPAFYRRSGVDVEIDVYCMARLVVDELRTC